MSTDGGISAAAFVAAAKFDGPLEGYCFKMGEQGLGYYTLDKALQPCHEFKYKEFHFRPEPTTDKVESRVWPAGSALAIALCDGLLPDISSLRLCELGAGTGITSAVAAQLGATVVATELSDAVPIMQRNLALNTTVDGCGATTAHALTWGTRLPSHFAPQFDVIMGADVTYIPELLPPLLATILQLAQLSPRAQFVLAHSTVHKTSVDELAVFFGKYFEVERKSTIKTAATDVAVLLCHPPCAQSQRKDALDFLENWFATQAEPVSFASHVDVVDALVQKHGANFGSTPLPPAEGGSCFGPSNGVSKS